MEKKTFVSRVNQLDAYTLDKEVSKIIHEQLTNVYKELPPGILSKFQPEIDAVLKTFIWTNSVLNNSSTFGQQILAITYQDDKITKNRLILHYLMTICASYAREISQLRLTNFLVIQRIVAAVEFLFKILTILNFFRFLKTGQYPSVLDYVLRWNHTSKSGAQMRNLGYAYMNRELMWTGFLELLNVTLPLINYHSLKRKAGNLLSLSKDTQQTPSEPILNVNSKCAICLQRPVHPHHIRCSHVFCYYCIQGNVMLDSSYSCPICDFQVLNGDIYQLEIKSQ